MIPKSQYSVYAVSNLVDENPNIYRIENPILNVSFTHFIPTKSGRVASKVCTHFIGTELCEILQKYRVVLILPNTKEAGYTYQKLNCQSIENNFQTLYKSLKIITNPNFEFSCDTLGNSETILTGDVNYLSSMPRYSLDRLFYILDQIRKKYIYNSLEVRYYNKLKEVCQRQKHIKQLQEARVVINRVLELKSNNSFGVPMIKKVIYNAPNTVVYWMDGTKTIVTATEGEIFNKEIGLAMAISKKYFSASSDKPRAAFKNVVKNASDYTAATEHKHKQKELKEVKKLEAKNGDDDNI